MTMAAPDAEARHPIFTGLRGVCLALFMAFCVALVGDLDIGRADSLNLFGLTKGGASGVADVAIKRGLPMGYRQVSGIVPGGPMALVGVRDGDLIKFDTGTDRLVNKRAGDRMGITIQRDGIVRHATITVAAVIPLATETPTSFAHSGFQRSARWLNWCLRPCCSGVVGGGWRLPP